MTSALPLFVGALPLCLYAAWSDLRLMIIPNWVSIGLLAVFVVVGLMFLPLPDFGWRLAIGFGVLAVGFVLNAIGLVGGGDVKMLAAFAPFISLGEHVDYLMILSISLLATLALHRIAMRIGFIRTLTPDWKSWTAGRYFPMGISITTAGLVYLGLKAF